MTKRNFRELQNKLTKIVVVFDVTADPYRCFAISLQIEYYQIFCTEKNKQLSFMRHQIEHSKRVK